MNPLKQMKNRDRQRDKFQGSHHRHSIGTVSGEGPLKGSKREEQEKKIANTEGAGYERLQLNFEINKEDRRVFLDVAPMKYLQPTIQMLSGNTSLGKSNLQLYWLWYKILNQRGNSHQAMNIKTFFCI
ncbi:uncharacterized protein LOC112029357 isoform X1 [Quercus suber]|uniref:uncharacterized protein LOC112029357 isoform X1 n=1 Tax=Quercus suber TaxID=58331 RepID=UPI0032DE3346